MNAEENTHRNRFIPGLELSERFFSEAVRPLLAKNFPGLRFSAGRLDFGSDVLGFDTPQSMDHDWGPRLTLFLDPKDFGDHKEKILHVLGMELPFEFLGFSTHFESNEDHTKRLGLARTRPIQHAVLVATPDDFFRDYLGWDSSQPLAESDWLMMPQQKLRALSSGRLFHDDLGMEGLRKQLAWYPQDLWLHLMACQWRRIDQEEPFVGRCGDVGDELGSRLLASKLLTEVMKLCFLMEKMYAPYSKWLGTAFKRLDCHAEFQPLMEKVLVQEEWKGREAALGQVYLALLKKHNALGLTSKIEEKLSQFFSRPYQVPASHRVVEALGAAIRSPQVKALPKHIGSVDQISDSVDVLSRSELCRKMGIFYKNNQEDA